MDGRWWAQWRPGLLVGLWAGAAGEGIAGLVFGDDWDWAGFAVRLVGYAIFFPLAWTAGDRLNRRLHPRNPVRLRREAAREPVRRALRSGRVPQDVDATTWRLAVATVDRDLRAAIWVIAGSGVLVLGLVVGAAVRVDPGDVGVWLVAVAVPAVAALALRSVVGRRADLRRLQAGSTAPS